MICLDQGRIQDFQLGGAPMVNGYEHDKRSIPRGVWGHAPPGKFCGFVKHKYLF